jgi:hypothetical protein
MLLVCDDELSKARKVNRTTVGDEAVGKDVDSILDNKTPEQLSIMKSQIEDKLARGGPIDVDYWETLLGAVDVWMAKVRITTSVTTIERYAQTTT